MQAHTVNRCYGLLLQVMISSETGNIPRTEFNQAFDFENQVLRDFSAESQPPNNLETDESGLLAEVQRYTQLNHAREAVVMALVAVTTAEDKDTKVNYSLKNVWNNATKQACVSFPPLQPTHLLCVPFQVLKFIEEYSNLKSMGFAPEVITGAMVAYPNDIAEATEACISGCT